MEETKFWLRLVGFTAIIGLVGLLLWLITSVVMAYPAIAVALLLVVGGLLCGGVVMCGAWIAERTSALLASRQQHELDIEWRRDELTERRARRVFEVYQYKQSMALQLMQAQVVTLGQNDVLALRTGNGFSIEYEPPIRYLDNPRVKEADYSIVEDCQPEIPELLPPAFHVPKASELLESGELTGGDVLMGYNAEYQAVRRLWKQIKSIIILGLMGGGKTNTAAWLVGQEVLHGARIALIDKHARSDESMYYKLRPLAASYDTPCGDSVKAAQRVIRHVRSVFYDRMNKGIAGAYRLIFCIDEFTALARAATDKNAEWYKVAIDTLALVEELNQEGRKFGVCVVAAGQAANASRSGGTEVRDLFNTRIIHGMRAKQAGLLGLTEEKKEVQKLETGQVYVDIEGKENPFFMQVPEVDEAFLMRLTEMSKPAYGMFAVGSQSVQGSHSEQSEQDANMLEQPNTEHRTAKRPEHLSEQAERVRQLRNSGVGKIATIEEVWRVKRGGSEAWKQAVSEYAAIVEKLVQSGLLPS